AASAARIGPTPARRSDGLDLRPPGLRREQGRARRRRAKCRARSRRAVPVPLLKPASSESVSATAGNPSVLQPDGLAPRRYSWLSFSGLLLIVFVSFDFVLLSMWGYGGDWSPLWVAGRLAWRDPAGLYDFALVTKLQLPILGNLGSRPFVYPPSAITLLAPLTLLP